MPSTLKFYVREDGRDFSISDMTEPESAAIAECVSDLIPSRFQYTMNYWFEVDVCILEESDEDEDSEEEYQEPTYGLLRCFTHNPRPRNSSQMESRLPWQIPQEVLTSLAGKTFRVYPRQLGLNPWGKTIEVKFEDIQAPAPVPVPPVPVPDPNPSPAPSPAPAPAPGPAPIKPTTGIKVSDLIAAALKAH